MNHSPIIILLIASCLCLTCSDTFAHGNAEKPLFVAENGVDAGDCVDPDSPCATINFALTRVGKGGQIRVTEGTYAVENVEDLFHIVSGVVEVVGGFRKQGKSKLLPTESTVLTGVPFEYREQLQGRGFKVIADRKEIDSDKVAKTQALMQIHQQLKSSIPFTPCVGGSAAGLPCNNIDLLSHVAFSDVSGFAASTGAVSGADVWGFVDLNTGREYAIVGFSFGTAVFDVSDATNPREVGFVAGQRASWRDIKVYQAYSTVAGRWRAYAYVTTDGASDGLVVIDMSGLPHSISRVNYASDVTSAHNVYATSTEYSTGISVTGDVPTLIVAGSNLGSSPDTVGQFRAYSLANPASPSFVPGGSGSGYMHDATSLVITDARKDNQCVNGGTYCEVLLDFNENLVEIFDITNTANPVRLNPGSTEYLNRGYVHSGWWSEDKQHIFVHDELDEQRQSLPTTLRIFSIANLTQPSLAGTWTGPTGAIDHNGFVRGNRYYMSNYTRGLTVLDITDPTSPSAVGRLDTYPVADSAMFNGAWGAYPFFYSGNIAISDIDSGFYMVADNSRDVVEGSLTFTAASFAVTEGQQAQVTIQRSGGSIGDISVDYEILGATADMSDVTIAVGTVNWGAGDTADKSINAAAVNDGVVEGLERLIIRLINPTGGSTLGNLSTTSVYLSDPGSLAEIRFSNGIIGTSEDGFATLIGVVRRHGNAVGAISVDYSMFGGDAIEGDDFQGSTSGTINWPDGDGDAKILEFIVNDDGVAESDEFFQILLSNPVGATIVGSPQLVATIVDGNGDIPPPPIPEVGGSGGGSFGWLTLAILGIALRRRRINQMGAV
jgi:choice-of-anchor B domain-containing protein